MYKIAMVFLVLIGCASPQKTDSEKIFISIDIKDRDRGEKAFSSRSRLTTKLSLKPLERTILGGMAKNQRGENSVYAITAMPSGDVIRFVITRGEMQIGQMQLLRKKGEAGTIESDSFYQKIVLLSVDGTFPTEI